MGVISVIGNLTLTTLGWEQALNRVQANTQTWANDIGKEVSGRLSAAFGGAALVGFGERLAHDIGEHVGQIKDLAEQYGITTDELQHLQAAAAKVGLPVE